MVTLADDTAITAVNESKQIATYSLQQAMESVDKWPQQWKMKLHLQKTIHVIFALCNRNPHHRVYINGVEIQQLESAKYLGLDLDSRLAWKYHLK